MGNGNILIPLERLEDLELGINGVAIPLLKDNWVADNGAYKQTVAIDGMKDDSEPFIVLSTVEAEATDEELNAYACLEDRTIVEDGSITFFASEIPSISFTVIAKGVIASEGQAIADVTALVGRISELESTEVLYKASKFRITKNGNVIDIEFMAQTCDADGYLDIGDVLKDYIPSVLWSPYCAFSYDCSYGANATNGMVALREDGRLRVLTRAGGSVGSSQQYCGGHLTYVF